MLITVILILGCANLIFTYVVGFMVSQLTVNPEFLSAMKRIAELEKKLNERYK